MTKCEKIINKMNKFGFATHASILYLTSGFFIYLPIRLFFDVGSLDELNSALLITSSLKLVPYIISYVGGWFLYLVFAFFYFHVRLFLLFLSLAVGQLQCYSKTAEVFYTFFHKQYFHSNLHKSNAQKFIRK